MTVAVDPGQKACGPSYASGGEPGYPPSLDEVVEMCELECDESPFIKQDVYRKAVEEAMFSKFDDMRDDYPEPDYDGYDD